MLRKYLLVACISGLGLSGCSQHPASLAAVKERTVPAGEIGSRLPDFSAQDLGGGKISSEELRGKVVLVDFWATWCQPCKKEMPGYQKLLDQYGARGFVVVGLKFDTMKDTEDPMRFAQRIGVRYPLAVASEEVRQKFGGIEGLPTTLVYDRQGILREKVVGFEYTDFFETAVKGLL